MRGFTSISEKLDAQELAGLLNEYLSEMTGIVFRHSGTLDKYIGDAVMAFWGAPFEAPGHATNACHAALEMIARLKELQSTWRTQGKPQIDIGVGLSTGVASVGNMGSSLRYGYTALGDTVNLSSRLEGLNKEYGTHILLSETTYAGGRSIPDFPRTGSDPCKRQTTADHALRTGGRTRTLRRETRRAWKNDIELSLQGRPATVDVVGTTRRLFSRKLLERWPDDGPARMYPNRCREYVVAGPEHDWDGVYVMTHK